MIESFKLITKLKDECDSKDYFVAFMSSLVLSLFIISGPVVFLINLLIYKDFTIAITFGIGLSLAIFITLLETFLNVMISKKRVKGLWKVSLLLFIISVSIFEMIIIFLMFLGVVY